MSSPITLSQQTRFTSASEVTTMKKRNAVNNYYSHYPQDQKRAYASTYTTFKAGAVYNDIGRRIVSLIPTCQTNTNGFVQASAVGEKQTKNMYVASKAYINNPQ
jgi:hypothetical protein